jgi:regulator of protease activity HflC (stomatin/prohibitin superfamily)
LADVVRTPIGKMTIDDKLAQRVRYHNGEMVELAMPDKIKAVELDAKLAGELKDSGMSVNVGLALVNERLQNITLPRDAA